jgi:hypothetical protein
MPAIDFPNAPEVNDIFTANGRSWKWDGNYWNTAETTVLTGPTGPSNTLAVGTTSATGPNGTPSVSITGTAPNQTINFVLQQGPTGPIGSIDSGIDGLTDVTISSPVNGNLLTYNSSTSQWINLPAPISLPSQTGNTGRYLQTDGATASWQLVIALPSQTGNSGELLTTDGTNSSWSNTISANSTTAVGLIVRGLALQTANIQEWATNTGTVLASISSAGKLTAVTKSFEIDHPTKDDLRLRYGSLEGPENGVYTRGKIQGNIIELPDYWTGLVDEDSITVNLTAIGKSQDLFVESILNNKVLIGGSDINAFYTVFAERKDVEKLIVEF